MSSHGLLTSSYVRHMSYHVLVTVLVYWRDPSKIQWGGHFGVLTGMQIFLHITVYSATNPESHRSKLGVRSPNAIKNVTSTPLMRC